MYGLLEERKVGTAAGVIRPVLIEDGEGLEEVVEDPRGLEEVVLKVTESRMGLLRSGHWRKSQQGDYNAVNHVLAHFMVGENGQYMDEAGALDILDEYSLEELGEVMVSLNEQLELTSVPKG